MTRIVLGLALAALVGCSGVPSSYWVQRTAMPEASSPDGRQPLLDCSDPVEEGAFCPENADSAGRDEQRAVCMEMTEASEVAFFGHSCLAAHALWAADHVQIRSTSDAPVDTVTSDAQVDAASAAIRRQRSAHLMEARVHLDAALALRAENVHLLRHRVAVDAKRLRATPTDPLIQAELLEGARSLATHPSAETVDLRDALQVASVLASDGFTAQSRALVEELVSGRDDFAEGHVAIGRWALADGALAVAATRLDEARTRPGAPADAWVLRAHVALLERDLATARGLAAEVLQSSGDAPSPVLVEAARHPVLLAVRATDGSTDASTAAEEAGIGPLVDPLDRVARAVRSKAGVAAAGALALEFAADDDTVVLALALGLAVLEANPADLDGGLAVATALERHGFPAVSGDVMVAVTQAASASFAADPARADRYRLTTADHLASLGDVGRAQQYLEQVGARGAAWHFIQGYIHVTNGDREAARAAFGQARDLDPTGEIGAAASAALGEL